MGGLPNGGFLYTFVKWYVKCAIQSIFLLTNIQFHHDFIYE